MDLPQIHARASEILNTLGLKNVLSAVEPTQAKKLIPFNNTMKTELDHSALQNELDDLQSQALNKEVGDPVLRRNIEGLRRTLEDSREFPTTVESWSDIQDFVARRHLSFLFGNPTPPGVRLNHTKISNVVQRLQERISTHTLPRKNYPFFRQSVRHIEKTLKGFIGPVAIINVSRSRQAPVQGGYTTSCLDEEGGLAHAILIGGNLSASDRVYVAAHELGHCVNFYAERHLPPSFTLEVPFFAREALADYGAFYALSTKGRSDAMQTLYEWQGYALQDLNDTLLGLTNKQTSVSPPMSLGELESMMNRGLSVLLFDLLVSRYELDLDGLLGLVQNATDPAMFFEMFATEYS